MWLKSFSLAVDSPCTNTERSNQITNMLRFHSAARVRHRCLTFISVHSASTLLVSVFFSKPTLKRRTSPQISAIAFINISSTQSKMAPQREVQEFNVHQSYKLQQVTPSPCPSGGVFLRDLSCYFSVLEDGRPRDKLECGFLLLSALFYDIHLM